MVVFRLLRASVARSIPWTQDEFLKMKSDAIIEKIRAKLKDSDPDKRTVVYVIQFNLTDASGALLKSVVFDFKDLKIFDGAADNADCKVTMSDDDFFAIGSKQTTLDDLVKGGKATIEGNEEALDKMMDKIRSHK